MIFAGLSLLLVPLPSFRVAGGLLLFLQALTLTFSTPGLSSINEGEQTQKTRATSLTTTLHVDHGTLIVGAGGGATVVGGGSSTVTLTGRSAQIDAALGAANNVLYHGASDVSGLDHPTMTSNDGSLSDIDVLTSASSSRFRRKPSVACEPPLTLDSTGHILDQPAADFASAYGAKALYFGLPDTGSLSAGRPSARFQSGVILIT